MEYPSAVEWSAELGLVIADAAKHTIITYKDGNVALLAGKVSTPGDGPDGPALESELNGPQGIAVMGSTVWISDTGNHKIKEIKDGQIRTIAGSGVPGLNDMGFFESLQAQFNNPMGLEVRMEDEVVREVPLYFWR